MNGNKAAAAAALLCRSKVAEECPITPMSVLTGASLAGSRTFAITSSQGLAYLYESCFQASTFRLPVVMAIINREMSSQQNTLAVRDAGWLQIYVENNQEILDTIILAFRLAEDPDVCCQSMSATTVSAFPT